MVSRWPSIPCIGACSNMQGSSAVRQARQKRGKEAVGSTARHPRSGLAPAMHWPFAPEPWHRRTTGSCGAGQDTAHYGKQNAFAFNLDLLGRWQNVDGLRRGSVSCPVLVLCFESRSSCCLMARRGPDIPRRVRRTRRNLHHQLRTLAMALLCKSSLEKAG